MKFFIVLLLVFVSFSDGKAVPLDATVFSTDIVRDPPPATNVTVNATWTFNSAVNVTNVVLTVYNLNSLQYAAVGLSQNHSMGEAHVFICKRLVNDQINIQRFVNPGGHQHPAPAGTEQGGLFTPLPSVFIDGVVTCQFTLSNFASETVEQPNTLRPLSQSGQYYPIFATGLLNSTNDVQYHNGREPQPGLVQLNQNQNLIYHENSTKPFDEIYRSS